MLANYIKVSYRNLLKYKTYTLINILGLSVGIASVLFISIYVINELRFDKFNINIDNTYRVCVKGEITGEIINQAVTSPPMAAAIKREIPEVSYVTRIARFGDWLVRYKMNRYNETGFLFADSSFFDVFSYVLIQGDPKTALKEPYSVVLTSETATRYFGNENPLGKKMLIETDTTYYTVTGVIEPPKCSHLNFNLLGSLNSIRNASNTSWLTHMFYTYAVLKEGSSPKKFETDINVFIEKYVMPEVENITGNHLTLFQTGDYLSYFIQPLKDIHLHSHLQLEICENGNINYVYIFTFIAILLLCIAVINFMNLATARSSTRAREIAIRKVSGSGSKQLIGQFLIESVFLSLVALILALVFVEMLTPGFQKLVQKEIGLNTIHSWEFYIYILVIGIFTGLLAGSYPAIVLSAYDTVTSLKGQLKNNIQTAKLRNVLVVSQFAASVFLLVCSFTIYRQINYMLNRDMGFDKEHVLVIKRSDGLKKQIDGFKKDLLNYPEIKSVANSTHVPGKIYWRNAFFPENNPNTTYLLNMTVVSPEFAEVLKLEITDGRFFSGENTDTNTCVINQTTAKYLGFDNPIGKIIFRPINNSRVPNKIIGVVKDFNYSSLHNPIEPMIMVPMRRNLEGAVVVRVSGNELKSTLSFIENTWNKYTSDYVFEYSWLNEDFNKLYNPEKMTASVIITFSILTIFIACLGLFGLIAFTTSQRTKEIGIRKSFGASYGIIFYTIIRDILKLVFISLIIAWPLAYLVLNYWLRQFSYRISINITDFIVSAAIAFLIAIFTISTLAIKAALKNPAQALHYE